MTKIRNAKPKSDLTDLGFAAFVDLRDSTYLWNQNPDLAEQTVVKLAEVVQAEVQIWQGRVGNFTGDGFLLLFNLAEYAIRAVAGIVNRWEADRIHYCDLLTSRGAPPPDEFSLMIRSGIAHGHYRMFQINDHTHFAGEAINRASRCENSSKKYFEQSLLPSNLNASQRIFITQDVFNLIRNKTDYSYSEKLTVEFKGYERPTTSGLTASPDYIVGIWPKAMVDVPAMAPLPYAQLKAASQRASKVDTADRLVEAARSLEARQHPLRHVEAPPIVAEPGRTYATRKERAPRDVLLGAIMSYREALELLPDYGSDDARAEIHSKLALAHASLVEHVPPVEQAARLDEAAREMRYALNSLSQTTSHFREVAFTHSNLARIHQQQAELATGRDRFKFLTEAAAHLRAAINIHSSNADVVGSANCLSALAVVLLMRAENESFENKSQAISEAVIVLRSSLMDLTPTSTPEVYASTQSDLAIALRMYAEVTNGEDRAAQLAESEMLARSAVRTLKLEQTPARFGRAQESLGRTLFAQIQMLPHIDKASRLTGAVAAFRQALRAHSREQFPLKFAATSTALARALSAQASILSGTERVEHFGQARRSYGDALGIYKALEHSIQSSVVQGELELLER